VFVQVSVLVKHTGWDVDAKNAFATRAVSMATVTMMEIVFVVRGGKDRDAMMPSAIHQVDAEMEVIVHTLEFVHVQQGGLELNVMRVFVLKGVFMVTVLHLTNVSATVVILARPVIKLNASLSVKMEDSVCLQATVSVLLILMVITVNIRKDSRLIHY